MNVTNLISLGTIALLALTPIPSVLSETPNPSPHRSEQKIMTTQRPTTFKPGINRGSKERGVIPQWTNRFAVMSWHEWQNFNGVEIASRIKAPTLIVHSDGSALPNTARKFYNQLGGQKQLVWTDGQHLDFYDRDPQVSTAVSAVATHFQKTLANSTVSQK